jgi:hypothetical protein
VTLLVGGFGHYRCEFGTGMGTLIGVVAENVDQALAKGAPQAIEYLAQPAAVGTQIITVNEDGHPVVACAIAADVVSAKINRAKQTLASRGRAHWSVNAAPSNSSEFICGRA